MKQFVQLFRKDLESVWLSFALFSLLIAGWDTYLYLKVGRWPADLAFGLSTIPIGFIVLWTIWEAIQVYRHEWQTGGIYTMLSLPQPGWKLALAKLAAVLVAFTVQSLVAFGGAWFLYRIATGSPAGLREFGLSGSLMSATSLSWFRQMWLTGGAIFWLMGFVAIVVAQTAYVLSKLATRLQFLLLLVGFLVLQWVITRMGALGHYVFSWLPDITLRLPQAPISMAPISGDPSTGFTSQTIRIIIDSGPVLGAGLGLVVLFLASAWIVQNALEV